MFVLHLLQEDAEEFITVAKEVNANTNAKCEELSDDLLREIAYGSAGDLCPMAAVIGGITAQEVMKVKCLRKTIAYQCHMLLTDIF